MNKKRSTSKYFARSARFGVRRHDAAFQFKLRSQSDAAVPNHLDKITVKTTPVMLSEAKHLGIRASVHRWNNNQRFFAPLGMTIPVNVLRFNAQRSASKYFARAARFGVRRHDAGFQFNLRKQSDAAVPSDLEKDTANVFPVIPSEGTACAPWREESHGVTSGHCCGMTDSTNALTLLPFNPLTTP